MTTPFSNAVGAGSSILTLNAGSSSLKFAVFSGAGAAARLLSGKIDRIGSPEATFTLKTMEEGRTVPAKISAPDHASCVSHLFQRLAEEPGGDCFTGVGHRIVHGGPRYTEPQLVGAGMMDELRRLCPFAPEHLPAEISLITAVRGQFPNLPQVACFDTAFHRDLPRLARLLPIPRRFEAAGVRRYGFHGLSYEFLMEELGRLAGAKASAGRVILAHLGNGASLAAIRAGKCIDTSMAFTPAAGLMMGRRSGDLDPGLAAYLSSTEGMSLQQFHQMVNHDSGLLGVSEVSSDMRELLSLEGKNTSAAEAIGLFCYQAMKWIGSFAAALGGLETLVFSGGIGENNPSIRQRICAGLGFLGIELDEARNAGNATLISADAGRVAVRVLPTDEELMIARSVRRVLSGVSATKGMES